MAKVDGKPEDQHYVPKMLLRGFLAKPENKEQVWVFDKHEGRSFRTHIRNIATERDFYDLESGVSKGELEAMFSELEDKTANVIGKIVSDQSLATLDTEQKGWLSLFIATQSLRTKHFREVIKTLNDGLSEHIKAMGLDPKTVDGFQPIETEDDLKAAALVQFVELTQTHVSLLEGKVAFLTSTSPDRPFWISDHPVVMHNTRDFGPYGNIGLAVPGIEIYLPLNSTLLMGLWCPSLADAKLEELEKAKSIRNELSTQFLTGEYSDLDETKFGYSQCENIIAGNGQLISAMRSGGTVEAMPENVTYYNHLQVTWSHRFVASPLDDFELATRMIADNPKYCEGLKPTFG